MSSKVVIGNSKTREDHKRIILNFIRKNKVVSRTDIYQKTNISKPTVTRVIEDLLADKMILESGVGDSGIGRKPVKIELNSSAFYCVGVNISKSAISTYLVDLHMNIKQKKVVSIKNINTSAQFLDKLTNIIKELMNESKINYEKILGIGIGIRGVLDYEKGILIDFSTSGDLCNVPIKEHLENEFKLKVFIDNNAHTRVLGEYWYGYGVGYKDIIFIICSEGLGCGIISEGRIIRGKSNATQSFGHMKVNMNGRQCSCGGYGCIESQCSTDALEKIAKESLKSGRKTILTEKVNFDYESLNYKKICECAEEQDYFCRQLLDEAAQYLSTGIANLIGILNPEVVILSGNLIDASEYFHQIVIDMTKQKIVSPLAKDVIFKKRRTNDNLYEISAATMVLREFFKA